MAKTLKAFVDEGGMMTVMKKLENDVIPAFEVLLEEIEAAVNALNRMGAEAFEKGDYGLARDLIDKGSQMA